jgi:hypothetical protein
MAIGHFWEAFRITNITLYFHKDASPYMNKQPRTTSILPPIRGEDHKFRLSIQTGSSPVGSALFFRRRLLGTFAREIAD